MKTRIQPLIIFALVLFFSGCKKNDDTPLVTSGSLVSVTAVGSYTKANLQTLAGLGGFGNFSSIISYDVDFYKLIYKTDYKGQLVDASGIVAVPKNTGSTPSLISAQHGTMFKDTDAPSNFPATFSGFEVCAAAGYITAIPDFIGYGVSKDIVHPYYDQHYSGTAVVDMILAMKTFLAQKKIAFTDRLFLVGYSEGGYVTMAAQKEIETHTEHKLTLTAAAAGAGGYDLNGMLSAITTTTSYNNPSYLALILQSYNTTYSWNRPYTDFYQAQYASKFPALLDGSKSGADINAALTTSPTALFTPAFFDNLKSATGEPVLKQALVTNSFGSWYPKSPTRLYHGTADVTVFYQTSVTTFNQFKAAGATRVEFFPIPNGDHGTSIQPMMLDVLPWIKGLDK